MSKMPSYSMPLFLLDIPDAPESGQMPGGNTKMEWNFTIDIYDYYFNEDQSEITNYSDKLLIIHDKVRRHFSKGDWKTRQMKEAIIKYSLSLTFEGVTGAPSLEGQDLTKGYSLKLSSVGIDKETCNIIQY
jgi:hypothetical protein